MNSDMSSIAEALSVDCASMIAKTNANAVQQQGLMMEPSPPARGRGLKHARMRALRENVHSPPARGRGLKPLGFAWRVVSAAFVREDHPVAPGPVLHVAHGECVSDSTGAIADNPGRDEDAPEQAQTCAPATPISQ